MRSKIFSVPQDHVAQRADFDTNALLLDQLLQVREKLQLKAVADSLSSKHDGIHQVLPTSAVSLSAVEEGWHLFVVDLHLLLSLDDVLGKCRNLLCEVFFVNHVKSGYQLYESLVLTAGPFIYVLQHFVKV